MATPAYLFPSFFTEGPAAVHSEQLRLGTSNDGSTLVELPVPDYTSAGPAIGYATGPRPIRNPGKFPKDGTLWNNALYMAHSQTSTNTGYIGTPKQSIAKSIDRGRTWTPVTEIDCSVVDNGNGPLDTVWAPRFMRDPAASGLASIYLYTMAFRNAGGIERMQVYYTQPLTMNLDAWTVPAKVGGLPATSIYDPCPIVGEGAYEGLYFMVFIDKQINFDQATVYKSTSPTTGFVPHLAPNFSSFGSGNDSFTFVKINGVWRAYVDNFGGSHPRGVHYMDVTGGNWMGGPTNLTFSAPQQMFWPDGSIVRAVDPIPMPTFPTYGSRIAWVRG